MEGDPAPLATSDADPPRGAPAASQAEPGAAGPTATAAQPEPGGPTATTGQTEPAAADHTDPASHGYVYVVSDNYGFVGAFHSVPAAQELVVKKYSSVPMLLQRFPRAPGPCETVWVVLYRDLDAVAFVSNSRAEAERVRGLLQRVGLAYTEEAEYWCQPLGRVLPDAVDRLSSRHRAHQMYAGSVVEESLEALRAAECARVAAFLSPGKDGPLERAIREHERFTIMDCVVPVEASSDAPWSE